MKRLLIFGVAVLCSAMVSTPAARSQTPQTVANAFQTQVEREIAQFPAGADLYRRCDIFARMVDAKAELALQLRGKSAPGTLGIEDTTQDTSLEGDASRSTDDEDEPSIAINRRNPRIVLAGANDIVITDSGYGGMITLSMPAYLSTDEGMSWKTYRLPPIPDELAAWGDPMIVSGNDGTFYYAFLVDPPAGLDGGLSNLMVARSTDGKNWILGSPVVENTGDAQVMEDKETIAIDGDTHSPYFGRLYIAWTEFGYNDTSQTATEKHFLAYSDNKGDTWSNPVEYTKHYGYFALLRVGQSGTVFIASMTNDTVGDGMDGMSISTDGGNTFTDVPIANYTEFPLDNLERAGLKGDQGFRATPYPCFDLDSGNKILAAYGSYDFWNGDAALYEVESSDLGQSWSGPVQIGSPWGLTNDHYMPWVTVDPITHKAYISMSSSEEDTILNLKSRAAWCNYRTPTRMHDMGSRLFNPLLVTASGSDFLGDYAGSDAYDGVFAASWTENRPVHYHDGEIFAYVSSPILPNDPGSVTQQINRNQFDAGNISPNPASGSMVSIPISSNENRNVSIRLFDLKGNEVLSSNAAIMPSNANSISLDIHSLPAGVYHVLLTSGTNQVDRNLTILR